MSASPSAPSAFDGVGSTGSGVGASVGVSNSDSSLRTPSTGVSANVGVGSTSTGVSAGTGGGVLSLAVGFGEALRSEGVDLAVGNVVTFVSALGCLGLGSRSKVYWAGRASLLNRGEDICVYDEVFARFWEGEAAKLPASVEEQSISLAFDDDEEGGTQGEVEESEEVVAVRYSALELLREKDFAACTPEELRELYALMSRLRLAGATRRSRRLRPARCRRGRPDLRRTVRQALQTGGDPVRRSYRLPSENPRRLVLLVDVSGSMESYARALLRFAHAAAAARRRVEVFTLGTRLTRLTRELSTRDPDEAFDRATAAVADWSGGTRLGEALGEFCELWGVRGTARGAVVVVLSDGWDRGPPDVMKESMARLSRVAYRIVWVNPLKATPGYAPLAQGMAAALPYVDELVEGHSLSSLEDLAESIGV